MASWKRPLVEHTRFAAAASRYSGMEAQSLSHIHALLTRIKPCDRKRDMHDVDIHSIPPEPYNEISRAAQWAAKCATLQRMLETHRWRKQTHRTGIASSHLRTHHTSKEGKAYSVCRVQEHQQSEYHASGEIWEHIRTMLPEWFVEGEFFGVTLNRNTVCQPHRDKKNVGESAIIFMGDFQGGALLLENGSRFEERGVWHRYDGSRLLHWNEEITAGVKYSVIAHNNASRPLVYPRRRRHGQPSEPTGAA